MKKMRRLIPAFAMLMVAAIMLSTASFAWFTMGTYATATGMAVKAEAASSLLIINADTAGDDVALTFKGASNAATFGAYQINLKPATSLDNSTVTVKPQTTNGLVTLADATKVNTASGVATGEATYVAAAAGVNYVDYVAYIASAGVAIENQTLSATVSLLDTGLGANINNAITIDFWVADTAAGEYADTNMSVNLYTVNSQTTTPKEYKVDLKSELTIPAAFTDEESATEAGYIKVIMRVYFDGALVDPNYTTDVGTFVRNDQISLENMGFNVRFDIATTTTTTTEG